VWLFNPWVWLRTAGWWIRPAMAFFISMMNGWMALVLWMFFIVGSRVSESMAAFADFKDEVLCEDG